MVCTVPQMEIINYSFSMSLYLWLSILVFIRFILILNKHRSAYIKHKNVV